MDIFVLIFAALSVAFAVAVLTFLKNRKISKTTEINDAVSANVQPSAGAQSNASARRRALAAARHARARQRVIDEDDDEEEAEAGTAAIIDLPEGKIGAKKMAKLQAKAERKAQRESEEKIRQEKKRAQELADEERKKAELLEKEEERKRLEEEKRIREEKERKEHEEYLKLKEAFSVQEEGFEESEESESLLQDFINHIKENKVVVLEDMAAQFKLKTQDVINRINNLQEEGQLSGVIDDRGKFIYISQDELDSVAKFVKQRGRVSIVELVENSNMLIDLSPAA